MNYREFYAEAKRLANPWPPQTDETPEHPAQNFDREKAKHYPLDRVGYIPTGFEKLDALVIATGAEFVYNVGKSGESDDDKWPHYSRADDRIYLPPPESFTDRENYARTILHELSHWTMKALHRAPIQPFTGDEIVAVMFGGFGIVMVAAEEAVAEMSAAAVYEQVVPEEVWESGHDYALHYVRGWIDNAERLKVPADTRDRIEKYATEQAERASAFLLSKLEQTA